MGEQEKPAGHKVHLCKLRKDGKLAEIQLRELNPIVYCNKCKAKSNDPTYLCNPRTLRIAKAK